MKILITGATGFIGKNLVERFSNRDDIKLLPFHAHSGNLTNKMSVDQIVQTADIVIHAAAVTSGAKDITSRPEMHVRDNIIMNALLFDAAHRHKVKHVIWFSCTTMYQSSDAPVKESDFDANNEMLPQYFGVGNMKVACEKMAEFYSRIGDTRFTVLRHSNIYGPHDKFNDLSSHFMAATISKVMNAKDGDTITIWGDGTERRDMLYVDDLMDAVEAVLHYQGNQFELYNVGCGKSLSISQIVNAIIPESGKVLNPIYDNSKPTIPHNITLDCGLIKNVLRWSPKTSLSEGIIRTLDWYREGST